VWGLLTGFPQETGPPPLSCLYVELQVLRMEVIPRAYRTNVRVTPENHFVFWLLPLLRGFPLVKLPFYEPMTFHPLTVWWPIP
jgi:hypothetical protein